MNKPFIQLMSLVNIPGLVSGSSAVTASGSEVEASAALEDGGSSVDWSVVDFTILMASTLLKIVSSPSILALMFGFNSISSCL